MRFRRDLMALGRSLVLFWVGCSMCGCREVAGPVRHSATVGSITISYWQVGKTRVGRTEFEFFFGAEVENEGGRVAQLDASVSSLASATRVTDSQISFGEVGADSSAVSFDDLFSIVQDRRVLFDPDDLIWSFRDGDLPPDPGVLGDLSVAGLDTNEDGIRDDIERLIALRYTQSARTRASLWQYARAMQDALSGAHEGGLRAAARARNSAIACLLAVHPGREGPELRASLFAEAINTFERLVAYRELDLALSGEFFEVPTNLGAECEFDPENLPN